MREKAGRRHKQRRDKEEGSEARGRSRAFLWRAHVAASRRSPPLPVRRRTPDLEYKAKYDSEGRRNERDKVDRDGVTPRDFSLRPARPWKKRQQRNKKVGLPESEEIRGHPIRAKGERGGRPSIDSPFANAGAITQR